MDCKDYSPSRQGPTWGSVLFFEGEGVYGDHVCWGLGRLRFERIKYCLKIYSLRLPASGIAKLGQ